MPPRQQLQNRNTWYRQIKRSTEKKKRDGIEVLFNSIESL